MAIEIQEKYLFVFLILIVSWVAFLAEPSYFVTTIILIGVLYFLSKTEKLKYALVTLGIILAIFVSLLMTS